MAAYERSEHEKKYDRQMRLWGSHGQMNLETAHICCIGSGATASEALKNLVLPNVGHFTIIDHAITTAADKNNNFFVEIHTIGQPRAEVVKEMLLEMNSEVKGDSVVQDVRTLLSGDLSYFNQFSLILVCDPTLPIRSLLPLAAHLWTANIPLVLLQTKGLLGSARLQVREHPIIESHPGNDRYDLYVHPQQTKLWPELQAYCKQFKVFKSEFDTPAAAATAVVAGDAASASAASSSAAASTLPDGEEHAHIPYVAILVSCITAWMANHGGELPRSYDEKKEFKAFIRSTAWNGEEGNFDEAIDFAHRAYEMPKFDRFVQAVFDDASSSDDNLLRSSRFWLMVRSVKEFIAAEGAGTNYPVSQNLPDMHCKTAYYVQLKQIFQAKAEADFAAVQAHLARLLASLGLPANHIAPKDLDMFVRNIRTLRVIRTRSLVQEYGTDGTSSGEGENTGEFQTDYLREIIEEEEYDEEDEAEENEDGAAADKPRKIHNPKNVHWYLALRTADIFMAREGRAAGSAPIGSNVAVTVDQLNNDVLALQSIQSELLRSTGLDSCISTPDMQVLSEVCRSGSSEPHVTAAFLGGIASQIVLKIILKQYVPLNNTMIWNGLFASSNTYQL